MKARLKQKQRETVDHGVNESPFEAKRGGNGRS